MDVIIRKATKNDMPQVLKLIKELATFEKEPDAVVVTVEELEKEGFGPSPIFTCFVAESNKDIVGMALGYFRFSTWKGRTVHLEDLIVKEAFRGKGIGEQLYAAILKHAYMHKVKRVEWVVLNWNTDAINFYERTGAKVLKDWYIAQMDEEGLKTYIKNLKK
jgi:ribosomal protein S18 acetylase RimI-like enzyme